MRNISRKSLLIIGGVTIVILMIIGLIYIQNDSKKDVKIIKLLETQILPFVQENRIAFFFNMDWCRALQYSSHSVVEIFGKDKSSSCLTGATAFSEPDRLIFNEIKDKLSGISIANFRIIDTEFPLNYRPEHMSLPHESIGIAFHLDCNFCRTRYVYWPGYTQLPPDIEYEIYYLPINKDWYRVEQDWN